MDSPFSHLSLLIFALSLSFYVLIAQSQKTNETPENQDGDFKAPPPPPRPLPPPHFSRRPRDPLRDPDHIPHGIQYSPPMRWPPNHHYRNRIHFPPPPSPPPGMNAGQKLGLLFVGIAAIMQVGIVGFLVIKRRQLLKSSDRYETCT